MSFKPRNKRIMFRVTEEEYKYLQSSADKEDIKLSEYIRGRLQKVRILKGAKINIV